MKIKAICLILAVIIILMPSGAICVSGDTEHDKDLEEVLFGKNSSRDRFDETEEPDELKVLKWAAYFALDCIASSTSLANDEIGLACLKDFGVEGIPKQVSDFHYQGHKYENQHHERYTHLGWNLDYANVSNGDLSSWAKIRKPLLINSVRQVFLKGKKDLWSTIDFPGWFHRPKTNLTEKQIESMAALIYYVHVLGDHCYNTRSTINDRIPLARRTENASNPGLITDLKYHLEVLFSEQLSSSDYRSLIAKMNSIHRDVRALLGDNDYPKDDYQYLEYQKKARELMDELKERIPRLLEHSDFFPAIFNEPAA